MEKNICTLLSLKIHKTEANHQHHNLAERYVQVLKAKGRNFRHRYQTSTAQNENYLSKFMCELHNFTANKTLNYTIPHEKIWGIPQTYHISESVMGPSLVPGTRPKIPQKENATWEVYRLCQKCWECINLLCANRAL